MTFGPFGVARLDGQAVMVPHAAPGDRLEVTIVQERAGYLVARVEQRASWRGPRAASRRVRICRAAADATGSISTIPRSCAPKPSSSRRRSIARSACNCDPTTSSSRRRRSSVIVRASGSRSAAAGELGFYEAGSRRLVESIVAWWRRRQIRMPLRSPRPRSSCEEVEVVADARPRGAGRDDWRRPPCAAVARRARAGWSRARCAIGGRHAASGARARGARRSRDQRSRRARARISTSTPISSAR